MMASTMQAPSGGRSLRLSLTIVPIQRAIPRADSWSVFVRVRVRVPSPRRNLLQSPPRHPTALGQADPLTCHGDQAAEPDDRVPAVLVLQNVVPRDGAGHHQGHRRRDRCGGFGEIASRRGLRHARAQLVTDGRGAYRSMWRQSGTTAMSSTGSGRTPTWPPAPTLAASCGPCCARPQNRARISFPQWVCTRLR